MLELLFLLLPVAAMYGWYMGKRSALQQEQKHASRLSRDYVAGVNFLLSDQKDKAVNLFLDLLKEDSGAFEAHLTLGNLFRSRGEVDRAIRIHQSLMESSSLNYDQRLLAIQQLGRDYLVAGFYDRAEAMFLQLTDETEFRHSGFQQLLQIYQLTSDWPKAIEVAEKLVRLGKKQESLLVAHFYCEKALKAMFNEDHQLALTLLRKAESADKQSVRVPIMQGRILIAKNEDKKAITVLESVLKKDPIMVSEVLLLLQGCYQRTNNDKGWYRFLKQCIEYDTGSMPAIYLSAYIEKTEGLESAQKFLASHLEQKPSLRGFEHLIGYYLQSAEDGRAKDSLQVLLSMVTEQLTYKSRYGCQKCGFKSNTIYWHCPSCRSWSTVKPLKGLDG